VFQPRFTGFPRGDTREWICVSIALSSGWLWLQQIAIVAVAFVTLARKLPVVAIFAMHIFLFLLCILVVVLLASALIAVWVELARTWILFAWVATPIILLLLCILVAVVIAASFAFFWFETRKQKKRAEKNKEAAVTSEPGTSKSDKLGVG